MHKIYTKILFALFILTLPLNLLAQQRDRIQVIQQKLDSLAVSVTGLKQSVQLTFSGVSIQDYLIALGRANNISISIDPKLNFTINDSFTGITASNILVFLAKKYNLDLTIVGSIIYVTPYIDPSQFIKPPPKEIMAKYTTADNALSLELDNNRLTA